MHASSNTHHAHHQRTHTTNARTSAIHNLGGVYKYDPTPGFLNGRPVWVDLDGEARSLSAGALNDGRCVHVVGTTSSWQRRGALLSRQTALAQVCRSANLL